MCALSFQKPLEAMSHCCGIAISDLIETVVWIVRKKTCDHSNIFGKRLEEIVVHGQHKALPSQRGQPLVPFQGVWCNPNPTETKDKTMKISALDETMLTPGVALPKNPSAPSERR